MPCLVLRIFKYGSRDDHWPTLTTWSTKTRINNYKVCIIGSGPSVRQGPSLSTMGYSVRIPPDLKIQLYYPAGSNSGHASISQKKPNFQKSNRIFQSVPVPYQYRHSSQNTCVHMCTQLCVCTHTSLPKSVHRQAHMVETPSHFKFHTVLLWNI
jgi:hypothetical protein